MLCPNCKKEIPEGTQFCPGCGAAVNAPAKKQKKPITKKWWFWVIIVAGVIAVIGSVGGGDDDTSTPSGGESTSQGADAETTTKAAETTTVADNKYYVGETLDANGVAITFVSAEEWYGFDQYFAPDSGNKIIRIKIDVVNNRKSDAFIWAYDFSCYADNQPGSSYDYGDDAYAGSELSSGRGASGYIYFEIPETAESIEIEFETDFWSDEKAIFVVEL